MKAIGIDLGTTGIGGILLDVDNGKVIKSITKNSDAFIKTENSFEKIQDVEKIIGIAKEILEQLIDETVIVIGVTGQMHGIVYYDKNGKAVSPLYTWQDERGNLEYKNGKTYAEHLNSCSGYGYVTDFYNRENNLVPISAVGFCTIADYLVMCITGNKKPIINVTNGASFGLYDFKTKKSSYDNYQEVTDGFTIAGKYKGIPVSVAIGDNQASVLSSAKESDLLINVGTGSQVSIISDNISFFDNVETRPYFENKYITVGCALCGGRAYSLLKEFYKSILSKKTQVTDQEVYELMGEFLKDAKTFNVVCDTRFSGTRADKNIKGGFFGLTEANFNPSEITSSVLSGMANELYDLYNLMGDKRSSIVGTGNGVRKNSHFIKICEKLFGGNLKIPVHTEEASFGAVLYALIAINKFASVSKAQSLIKYQD